MKRVKWIALILILVFFAGTIFSGCGSTEETSSDDSYILYSSVDEMQADVIGTYTKDSVSTSIGEYYSTLTITSTKVTETASSSASSVSLSEDYEITEWIPEIGYIVLENESIIDADGNGTIFYDAIPYQKN